mmetsp:Transcript_12920/g.26051  ORF Transcript_12920/g.26051 Transcript_12920/m.26051 type:complete len:86 (-) Transcript_12920:3674-3931(-)
MSVLTSDTLGRTGFRTFLDQAPRVVSLMLDMASIFRTFASTRLATSSSKSLTSGSNLLVRHLKLALVAELNHPLAILMLLHNVTT